MANLTERQILDIVRKRLLLDLKAGDAYVEESARKIHRAALESFAHNVAIELSQRGVDVGSEDWIF